MNISSDKSEKSDGDTVAAASVRGRRDDASLFCFHHRLFVNLHPTAAALASIYPTIILQPVPLSTLLRLNWIRSFHRCEIGKVLCISFCVVVFISACRCGTN